MKRYILPLILLILAIAGVAYYLFPSSKTKESPVYPTVTVQKVEPQKIRIWSEFSGRLTAVDSAEIRPQVSGRITKVLFEDGAIVKEGDVLFVIDPRPYEAAVAKAQAALVTAKANANYAKLEMDRAANMMKTEAVAKRIYDERFNANEVAEASIKTAMSELKTAKVDLEHAYVQSPINGRAGRVELTLGNLVQAGPNAPLMTVVVANNPIYVDFEVDEQTYLDNVRNVAHNRTLEREIPINLYLLGNKNDLYKGSIYSFDNRLDVGSGTIRARAKFDNKDGVLVPGMFVTVAFSKSEEEEALLVPLSAISTDQNKKYVYIVNKENKVIYTQVTLGKEYLNSQIVLEGLKAGDKIIIKGSQHLRPNEIVNQQEAVPP